MADISPELLTFLMLAGVLVSVLLGYPLAIPVGAMGLIFGLMVTHQARCGSIPSAAYQMESSAVGPS